MQVTELQSQLKKQETKWNKKLRELSGSQQDILQVVSGFPHIRNTTSVHVYTFD